MSELSPEEYQKQYDAALADIDAGAAPANPPEKAEEQPAPTPAPEPEAPKTDEAAPEVDELTTLRQEKAKLEQQVAANKAWATKEAQRRAQLEREWEEQQRKATRPAILDEQPELADAIKHVVNDPAPRRQVEDAHQTWLQTIEAAHPGIFAADADPELVDALVAKRDASGDAWSDPMVAIRDIAEEKVAFAERQAIKRYEVEAKAKAAKNAMSVPGAGGSPARVPKDTSQEEADRWKNMSDADFDKAVKKVKGF